VNVTNNAHNDILAYVREILLGYNLHKTCILLFFNRNSMYCASCWIY